jgi:VIT1/CCC1 family predicted Fe2+/Mn2+ transporter
MDIEKAAAKAQRAEITEYHIYKKLAEVCCRDESNRKVLLRIAASELEHYNFWKEHTGRDIGPNRFKVWFYFMLARFLGLSFGLRMAESGEDLARSEYSKLAPRIAGVDRIERDESEHEEQLIQMIDEERLLYASSIVLGLNDALVELTGAMAGLTFALQDTRLVALSGLVTGIAASLSMGGSEYLATKTDDAEHKDPLKASLYTGLAYIFAVAMLVMPYLVLSSIYRALAWTLADAILIILLFTFYISVAKGYSFRKRFLEMAGISLGVAVISFFIGLLVRHFLGVDV